MKILLIGGASQLGVDLLRNNTLHEIIAPDQAALDIRLREMISSVVNDTRPDLVINAVAFHDVPLCESDPSSSFAINCVAVRDLAIASKRVGAGFISLSTDYVFDGEKHASYLEDDKPAPLQMFGISRLAGEYAALSAAPDGVWIIRTCGLYGLSDPPAGINNFVDQRIHEARTNAALVMGSDQIVSPTYSHDLSLAMLQFIELASRPPGVYHLVNEGKCSWYEFTRAIYEIMGITAQVKPIDRSGGSGGLKRPLYSALSNTKARALGIVLPSWKSGLERYLREKYGQTT